MGKKLRKEASTSAVLMTLLEPQLYRAIESVCKDALAFSGNHLAVRAAVNELKGQLIRTAEQHGGVITPEVTALQRLLDRASAVHEKPRSPSDALQLPETLKALTPEQHCAAQWVRKVWSSFERFLTMGARSYAPTSGGHSNAAPIGPFAAMGEDLHSQWKKVWLPWYPEAQKRIVKGTNVRHVNLVLRVLVDNNLPHHVDAKLIHDYNRFKIDEDGNRVEVKIWQNGQTLSVIAFEMEQLVKLGAPVSV